MSDIILEIKNITKLYPGVKALDNVNLEVRRGEVHALVGENGAGKSTLIKTISGAVEPTSGTIIVEGKEFSSFTPTTSKENGIAVVYQEFTLVPVLSAAENIFLGDFIRHGWICDQKAMNVRATEFFKKLDIEIDPNEKVKDLTTGYQQIVEIAKAIFNQLPCFGVFRRAEHVRKMSESQYRQLARKRNAVEGMPSVLRRRYQVDHMPVRGYIRTKCMYFLKVGAINVMRVLKAVSSTHLSALLGRLDSPKISALTLFQVGIHREEFACA